MFSVFGYLVCLLPAAAISFFVVVIPLSVYAPDSIQEMMKKGKNTLAVWAVSTMLIAALIFISHSHMSGGTGDFCEPAQSEHRC